MSQLAISVSLVPSSDHPKDCVGFLKVLIEFFVYFRLNLWNEIQKISNALFEVFYTSSQKKKTW